MENISELCPFCEGEIEGEHESALKFFRGLNLTLNYQPKRPDGHSRLVREFPFVDRFKSPGGDVVEPLIEGFDFRLSLCGVLFGRGAFGR